MNDEDYVSFGPQVLADASRRYLLARGIPRDVVEELISNALERTEDWLGPYDPAALRNVPASALPTIGQLSKIHGSHLVKAWWTVLGMEMELYQARGRRPNLPDLSRLEPGGQA